MVGILLCLLTTVRLTAATSISFPRDGQKLVRGETVIVATYTSDFYKADTNLTVVLAWADTEARVHLIGSTPHTNYMWMTEWTVPENALGVLQYALVNATGGIVEVGYKKLDVIAQPTDVWGDADNNGVVEEDDMNVIQMYQIFTYRNGRVPGWSDRQASKVDVNLDGLINDDDTVVLRYYIYSPDWIERLPLGDVSGDGRITTADLTPIRRHILGIETLSPEMARIADVNQDGIVSTADILRIRRWILGYVWPNR